MNIPAFADLTAEKPTYEAAQAEMAAVHAAFDKAPDAAGQIAAVKRWNEMRRKHRTWSSLVGLRFNQDTRNPQYKADRDYRDALEPKLTNLNNDLKKKVLASQHRDALLKALGSQAFALWDFDARAHSPAIEPEEVKISRLGAQYTELQAAASFDFKGERLNMPALGKYYTDLDRNTRHEARKLQFGWYASQRPKLDAIFDELVKLRHESARKLGLRSFIELGYLRMHRIDYGLEDIKRLRKQVIDEVVPLCMQLAKQQAATLGVDKAMYWDDGIHDAKGSPRPHGDHDWMVKRAQEMFDDIGHGLGDFFRLMNEKGLLDLKSREGKAGGGFCTSFPVYGVPFVFANFNGSKGDVEVFTHEMGHAFQNWSSRHHELPDYHWPTYESAEIHSMSLEFITWPWMEKFFEQDADRFRRAHLIGSLFFIPYGTAVDHFQHMVYERPDATAQQRFEMWRECERTYLPWRDYGDLPHASEGGFWQVQRHIYLSPFYYIDYVLAQLCALQFWVRVNENRDQAMQDYAALCKRGGEAPFQELAKSAGLKSPFEQGALTKIIQQAKDWLKSQTTA